MPRTFKLKEPVATGDIPFPFGFGNNGVPLFETLRVLSGAVDLEAKTTGRVTKLRYCNISQSTRRPGARTVDQLVDLVFDGDLGKTDLEVVLKKSAPENRGFWEELRNELCFCIYAEKAGKSVNSFLHLYRILELVSVALPLVYATQLADYREAIKFIKSLNKNDRDQDLAVLRHFTDAIAKRSSMAALTIDFPFEGMESRAATSFEQQLTNYVFCDNKIKHQFFETSNEGVSVDFTSVPSFIVSCRNRLFHNAISNENFKLDALHGADPICSVFIQPGLYWFGLLLSEIVKSQAARFV